MAPIVGVLETSGKYVYGMTKHNTPLYLFRPFDSSLSEMIVGSKEKNKLRNYIALVEGPGVPKIEDPGINLHLVRGNLLKILGPCGNKKVEAEALLWQYCPVYQKNSDSVFESKNDYENRVDLSNYFTINIDPPNCKDIDDCVSYFTRNNCHFFAITIADVAGQVDYKSKYMEKAYQIGQSFYSNDMIRSMLPKEIEENLSLLPEQTRLGVSFLFEWDFEKKEMINPRFEETILVNKASLTYEEALTSTIPEMTRIREFFKQYSKSDDSHVWIEKIMILYNIEAAKLFKKHQVGIFRKQSSKPLYDSDSIVLNICPFLAIEAAEYCGYSENLKHDVLKVDAYTQVTSPIRRYVDLVNQNILKNIIVLETSSELEELEAARINLCLLREGHNYEHFNQVSKMNRRHDRDLLFLNILLDFKKTISGWVLNIDNSLDEMCKIRVYIYEWKRIVNIKNIPFSDLVSDISMSSYKLKENISLDYFYDASQSGWKNKIVYKIY